MVFKFQGGISILVPNNPLTTVKANA